MFAEGYKKNFYVNARIYVLSPETMNSVNEEAFLNMPNFFNKFMKEDKRTALYSVRGYWLDIGHIDQFKQAQNYYQNVFERDD